MKAALHNLGCKVNQYETDAMGELLRAAGFELVPFGPGADVYVINTCTVTGTAGQKSRQMLHRARQFGGPDACVVAAGCYVNGSAEELIRSGAADILIGNNRKMRLPQLVSDFFAARGLERPVLTDVPEIGAQPDYEAMSITAPGEHTRAFIKIQDGCNSFCSYCMIPLVRGRVRSRAEDDICAEVRRLGQSGVKEIVLTGIQVSSYGTDLTGAPDAAPAPTLLSLLTRLASENAVPRIRLSSLEPRLVTEEFARTAAKIPQLCPHFHLSLQSGCAATLRRMNRHYTPEEYEEACLRLRAALPGCAVTTDVICGFPGETEEEFAQTKAFLERIRPYEMHVFPYSERPGTRAASLPDSVPVPVRKSRTRELIRAGERWSDEYRRAQIGRTFPVLLEEDDGAPSGFSPSYVRCTVEAGPSAGPADLTPGQIVTVQAQSYRDGVLHCCPV